ncbi:uncharacterized protein [Mycetomoellerius zeteki]|uniref:uncharacterized protein n=1 Tax=Mycetomoellerius zeteki TaxID=64791 RepID=UPI00084E5958|nr:PREDICTED: uncharacterized protein LOC108727878 [Trachymyrmex zeteki]
MYIISLIERLDLRVSVSKTEVVMFGASEVPDGAGIRIGDANVPIGSTVKYLGLTLNSRWTFREHFRRLLPKAKKMAAAISRLTNIGGPGERRRRMYASVVMSVIQYGLPIWAQTVARDRSIIRDVGRLERQLALRVTRAYRTISYDAAALLSRIVPIVYNSNRHRRAYLRRRAIIERDGYITPRVRDDITEQDERRAINRRSRGYPGEAVRGVALLDFESWMSRAHGSISYRMTQIITGHGCFESYLCGINRRNSPLCRYCRATSDTNVHTLLFYSFWAEERREMLQRMKDPTMQL